MYSSGFLLMNKFILKIIVLKVKILRLITAAGCSGTGRRNRLPVYCCASLTPKCRRGGSFRRIGANAFGCRR